MAISGQFQIVSGEIKSTQRAQMLAAAMAAFGVRFDGEPSLYLLTKSRQIRTSQIEKTITSERSGMQDLDD